MYIHNAYKMADIYETTIVCDKCNRKTSKNLVMKDGFRLRTWECNGCNKRYFHPLDLQEYEGFKELKNKTFKVKLRLVGNSYIVSIPKEIIQYQEELQKDATEVIKMYLEEPEKLSIFFSKRIRRFY